MNEIGSKRADWVPRARVRYTRNVDGWKRGDEVVTTRTARVERMIENGVLAVVDDMTPPVPEPTEPRRVWWAFLDAQGYVLHDRMTKRDLQDVWEGVNRRG